MSDRISERNFWSGDRSSRRRYEGDRFCAGYTGAPAFEDNAALSDALHDSADRSILKQKQRIMINLDSTAAALNLVQ